MVPNPFILKSPSVKAIKSTLINVSIKVGFGIEQISGKVTRRGFGTNAPLVTSLQNKVTLTPFILMRILSTHIIYSTFHFKLFPLNLF